MNGTSTGKGFGGFRAWIGRCGILSCLLFALSFFVLSLATPVKANTESFLISAAPVDGGARLMPVLVYLLDDSKQMTVDAVLAKRDEGAFRRPGPTPAVGLNSGALWLSFQIDNRRDTPVEVILEHLDANAHHVDLYWRQTGETLFHHYNYSLYKDRETRPLMAGKPAFPLVLPETSQTEYLVRIAYEGAGFTKADMVIWEAQQWHLWHFVETALWGIFIGATGLASLLSLYAWHMMRQRALLYYALYAVINISSFLTWPGFMQNILFPSGYTWALQSIPASMAIAMGLVFGREFMATKTHIPRMDKVLFGLIILGVVQIPVSLVDVPGLDNGALSSLLIELSFLSFPLMAVAAFMCWRKNVPEAGIFFSAWSIYTLSVMAFAFRDLGLMDTTWSNLYMIPAGVSIELIMLSYALVRRARQLRLEKDQLEEQYLASMQNQNRLLEVEVAARTADLEAARNKAEYEARTDGLTQLQNRRSFMEAGAQLFALARRQNQPLSIIALDIDYFKKLNDRHGHQAGDSALVIIAENIRQTLRESDMAGRIGGEEFAIICPDTQAEHAWNLAERLRIAIEDCRFIFDRQELSVTASLGVASLEDDASLSGLLHRADKALYAAKNSGRNTVSL